MKGRERLALTGAARCTDELLLQLRLLAACSGPASSAPRRRTDRTFGSGSRWRSGRTPQQRSAARFARRPDRPSMAAAQVFRNIWGPPDGGSHRRSCAGMATSAAGDTTTGTAGKTRCWTATLPTAAPWRRTGVQACTSALVSGQPRRASPLMGVYHLLLLLLLLLLFLQGLAVSCLFAIRVPFVPQGSTR